MNCQPNDLCVIVRVPGPKTRPLLNRIIRVTALVIDGGDACWEYEGPALMQTEFGYIGLIEDEFLRPIHGGDVSESEVAALYAPKMPEVAVEGLGA